MNNDNNNDLDSQYKYIDPDDQIDADIANGLYTQLDSTSEDFVCTFDFARISIASQDDILSMSRGAVNKTDTLNYRTLKPEKGGIFCSAIFGPTEDYRCLCKRYIGESFKGLVCERCGVIVGSRDLRRLFFGHIELETCVVHPWFYSYVCSLLQMTKKIFLSIINFEYFIFIKDSYDRKYKLGEFIKSNDYYSNVFLYDEIKSGGEAIYYLLQSVNMEREYGDMVAFLKTKKLSDVSDKEIRRFQVLKAFYKKKNDCCNLVIHNVLIIPSDLRPILYADGCLTSVDLNDIYRKLISRNNRLKKLIGLNTHKIIINNEKYMINQAVLQLMGPSSKDRIKSIPECIKGKKGYFRRALLGKRTDFSGRAAIVVGPELKIDECSIPVKMAVELFKPFILSYLIHLSIANSVLEAKRIWDAKADIVYRLLHRIVDDFPIVLNRAPTLHRHGIQAFKIKLTNASAIRISPLVCIGYNADFDGDQMAAHLPISVDARMEAYNLMLSTHNLILPSNGRLVLSPSKDIVMGIYYLTQISRDEGWPHIVTSFAELNALLAHKHIHEHTLINYRLTDIKGTRIVQTTYGRIIIFNVKDLDFAKIDFDKMNCEHNKSALNAVLMDILYIFGRYVTIDLLNHLTYLGFKYFTQSGISYCVEDMVELDDKEESIKKVEKKISNTRKQYKQGYITNEELEISIMREWNTLVSDSGDRAIELISQHDDNSSDLCNIFGNNIYLMYISGARGSQLQIQQVCALRGFMARPSGRVGNFIILSNLREGLNIVEYFESTHGERKGLSDTAVKTSKAGHFTRRLVDIAHSIITTMTDCKTTEYMEFNKNYDRRKFGINFEDAILGRALAEAITMDDGSILEKGLIINGEVFKKICIDNIVAVKVRSVIYCKAERGVCCLCYGMDLSTYEIVNEGSAVGVIAAQSIGEPGTQLTMRTTHSGGIAKTEDSEVAICAEADGLVDLTNVYFVTNSRGEKIVLSDGIIQVKHCTKGTVLEEIDIRFGYTLSVTPDEEVVHGQILAYENKNTKIIYSLSSGIVEYKNLVKDLTFRTVVDTETGIVRKQVISRNLAAQDSPMLLIVGEDGKETVYSLEPDMFITMKEGSSVIAGDALSKLFTKNIKIKDITGGLTKIVDLFESKQSINKAIISTHSGVISIAKGKGVRKYKQVSIIDPETSKVLNKFNIVANKHIFVQHGMNIKKGAVILAGEPCLQDILSVMGYLYLIKYLMGEISIIYEDQGANINYKHFEIIIKKMSFYGVITETQNDSCTIGDLLPISTLEEIQRNCDIEYTRLIMSITKVALIYKDSFMSTASFQQTIPSLAAAAIHHSIDKLRGIKENVIFSMLVPIGTGYKNNPIYNIVTH